MLRRSGFVAGLAAGVLTLVGGAAAHAEAPSWGTCGPAPAGAESGFSDSACTNPLEGLPSYAWTPASSGPFETEGKSIKIEAGRTVKVKCEFESGTGEITSQNTIRNLVLTLNNCEGGEGAKAHCYTPGGPGGDSTITTEPLEGRLGVVTQGAEPRDDTLGLELSGTGPSRMFAEIRCNALMVLRGGVIAQVVANVPPKVPPKGKNPTVSFVGKKGVQKITSFAGEAANPLEVDVGPGNEVWRPASLNYKKMSVPRLEFNSAA